MNKRKLQRVFGFGDHTIKRFVIVWMICLLGCLGVLALSLILSNNKLQAMAARIFTDARALESAHRLEIAILAERREDLLWRMTHHERHYQKKESALGEADHIVDTLTESATKGDKGQYINAVEEHYAIFKTAALRTPPPAIEKLSALTDELLQSIEDFRDKNRKQMMETVKSSENLNTLVDLWSEILIFVVTLLALFASFAVIKRVVKPTIGLMEKARKFGKGDLTARSAVTGDDEIGMLCKTFNTMAEDLCLAEKKRQDFIAAVAHDIKNPLVTIGGAAALLKKKAFSPEEESIWLDRIVGRVGYLEFLINDLMDSVQLQRGTLNLNVKEFDLTCLVRDIVKRETSIITTHRIVFTGGDEYRVHGDRGRIERVVLNLITNAVKYSPQNTTVAIGLERSDGNVVLSVKDEGVGISEDEMPFLFQPYKRLQHASELAEGTGLGLFSAKGIVEMHGGTMRITSEPGKGTTVEVLFPVFPGFRCRMDGQDRNAPPC